MRTEKDERKLSVYLPRPILDELNVIAAQLDRSKSWVLQKAWELARQDMRKFGSGHDSVGKKELKKQHI